MLGTRDEAFYSVVRGQWNDIQAPVRARAPHFCNQATRALIYQLQQRDGAAAAAAVRPMALSLASASERRIALANP
jgi:hypothetical protein